MKNKLQTAVIVASLVAFAAILSPAVAQQISRVYGTTSTGAPIAIRATSGGLLQVSGNGGVAAGTCFTFLTRSQICSPADGNIELLNNAGTAFTGLQFGGTTSSFPMLKRNGTVVESRLADDSGFGSYRGSILVATTSLALGGSTTLMTSSAAPSAPATCGTSPAVTASNGTAAFVVTGGTGGTATGCSVTLATATTGWNCFITNITQTAAHRADRTTVQTASTTTSVTWEYQVVSTGAATAFTASDVFRGICFAY